MTSFDETMRKAEEALKARRPVVNKSVVRDRSFPQTIAAAEPATLESDGHMSLNGVPMASVRWTKEELQSLDRALRDDLNSIITDLETAAPRDVTITVQAPDLTELGSLTDSVHYKFETLVKAVHVLDYKGNRKNVLKKGPMGGGKSTAGKQLAKLLDLPFYYLGQTIMPHDVMGYVNQVSGEYQWTAFTKAYVHGGIVYLEEMDGWSPNATLVINPPLANGYIMLPNGEMHERHKDCIIVACTNTWGTGPTAEYVGRNKLDDAFLDRFGIRIDWDYDNELEAVAANDAEVVQFVQQARYNARRYGIKVVISPRSSIDIADMVRAGFTLSDAAHMNFLAQVDKDQREMLLEDTLL